MESRSIRQPSCSKLVALCGVFVFLGMACCSAAAEPRCLAPDGGEWQDNQRLSLGKEPSRAAFMPFSNETDALKILPEFSDRQVSLDSESAWKFRWSKDPDSRPVDFWKPEYDVSRWESIKVPCSWQAHGANGRGGWSQRGSDPCDTVDVIRSN